MATPKAQPAQGMDSFRQSREYILHLARSFPCLEHKVSHLTWQTWDVDKFMEASAAWSSGERQCAKFIASVWNPLYAKGQGWTVDLMDFATADARNRQPLIDWLYAPLFP